MPYASAQSTAADSHAAFLDVASRVRDTLSATADLALLFVAPAHANAVAAALPRVVETLGTSSVIAVTVETVVEGDTELEETPAVALWAGTLPGAKITPLELELLRSPDGPTILGLPDDLEKIDAATSTLLLAGDPFSFPTDYCLETLQARAPGLKVLGGMASAAQSPGGNRLGLGANSRSDGAVGLLIEGGPAIRAVVSQGCRPVGPTFVVTKAERNIVVELAGRPAFTRLQEVFAELSAEDQALFRRGPHLGRAMNEYRDEFGRGDFLIRNIVGADADHGAIVIGDYVRVGATVQFQIRDAQTADDDLRELLSAARANGSAGGALLFTCNGRGTRLFPQPHHDAAALRTAFGALPLAGCFAAGEIGPVGGTNFVHGFTAVAALFAE
ncbi:MAG: FIST N-terminal domain-containing protein [Pirellulales bacterium]